VNSEFYIEKEKSNLYTKGMEQNATKLFTWTQINQQTISVLLTRSLRPTTHLTTLPENVILLSYIRIFTTYYQILLYEHCRIVPTDKGWRRPEKDLKVSMRQSAMKSSGRSALWGYSYDQFRSDSASIVRVILNRFNPVFTKRVH
jgi:hypothetical protein